MPSTEHVTFPHNSQAPVRVFGDAIVAGMKEA